jgi:hypothetical protein
MNADDLRRWCDALRIQIRERGDLTSPTYSAGMRAGILQTLRMLEVFIDRVEAPTPVSNSQWRVATWGDEPAHPSWRSTSYAELLGQLRDGVVEILNVEIVGPTLVHVRAIDAEGGRMFPVDIVLEEVRS